MLQNTHERDGAEHLAGAGLHSPDGFTPPGCPRCDQALRLVWRDTGGRPVRRLDCPACGLTILLRQEWQCSRHGKKVMGGYAPVFAAGRGRPPKEAGSRPILLSGLTEAQRERLIRDFRAACTLQIRAQARRELAPAELAAELPPDLRKSRALAMLQVYVKYSAHGGGRDVCCPACPEFKVDAPLARCGLCLGFKNVPRGVAEWWCEERARTAGPQLEPALRNEAQLRGVVEVHANER
jgi:hypothetical protein